MKEFENFLEICNKSRTLDPWARQRGITGYSKEIVLEAKEAVEAAESGDMAHLMDELGDVLIDWAHTCLLAGEHFTVREVIQNAADKLNRRKPYLKEGRKVTLEEARELWRQAKAAEVEQVDVVDENDKVIRACARPETDTNHLRRRAARVIIINSKGQLLLQKRAATKKIYPGCWDFGIVESLVAGEGYEHAAVRGLLEELNILAEKGKFRELFIDYYEDRVVKRITKVFELIYDGNFKIDAGEVSEAGWFSIEDVRAMLNKGEFPDISRATYEKYEEYKSDGKK